MDDKSFFVEELLKSFKYDLKTESKNNDTDIITFYTNVIKHFETLLEEFQKDDTELEECDDDIEEEDQHDDDNEEEDQHDDDLPSYKLNFHVFTEEELQLKIQKQNKEREEREKKIYEELKEREKQIAEYEKKRAKQIKESMRKWEKGISLFED